MTAAETSRRAVLVGALAAGGALGAAACSGRNAAARPSTSGPTASAPAAEPYAALAEATENLLVDAYAALAGQASSGALGTVPAAVTLLLTRAAAQHREHSAAWIRLRAASGQSAVAGTPVVGATDTLAALAEATELADGLGRLATLEAAAAATCLQVASAARASASVALAATIAPVEAQHAAVLQLLLGRTPVGSSFLSESDALRPTAALGTRPG